jgi:hypothetical protein
MRGMLITVSLLFALQSPGAAAADAACPPNAQRILDQASSLLGRAVPCGRLSAVEQQLKRIATACAESPLGRHAALHAATVRFRLAAQVCVKAAVSPKTSQSSAPSAKLSSRPSVFTPPARRASDALVAEAGHHVEDLRTSILQERQRCGAKEACPAAEALEKEQVEATVAYLQLTTTKDSGFADARRLLVGALTSDPGDLVAATMSLQKQGLAPEEAAKLAARTVETLAGSVKDLALYHEKLGELFASIEAQGPGGVERVSGLLDAMTRKGISAADGQRLFLRIADTQKGLSAQEMETTLRLVAYVRDPEVRRQWKASFDSLVGTGGPVPENLRRVLDEEQPDPNALLDIIRRMSAEQTKAMVDYAGIIAGSEKQLREEERTQRTPRNAYLLFSQGASSQDGCSAQAGFRAAVEEILSSASPMGIRNPTMVSVERAGDLERYIEEALCVCRHGKSCPGSTIPAQTGRCEGVLAVHFVEEPPGTRARGSLRFVSAPEGDKDQNYQLAEIESPPFSAGCDADARHAQMNAAVALIRDLDRRAVVYNLFPRVTTTEAVTAPLARPSRWNALILSGLPELRDGRRNNDVVGWVLAGTDLALSACTITSGVLAYRWRNDYANHGMTSLDAANTALVVAGSCLATLGAERIFSALRYRP